MADPLALAERVVTLRRELEAAEAAFHAAVGSRAPRGTPVPQAPKRQAPVVDSTPIAQKVRSLLQDGGRAFAFGDFTGLLGREHRGAIRAALKTARAKGEVRFANSRYTWVRA